MNNFKKITMYDESIKTTASDSTDPLLGLGDVGSSSFTIIAFNHQFKFKSLCPYCKGDLTYECDGWDEDDNGQWESDGSFSIDCSTEPDMDSDDWEDWMQSHSEMPYVHQLPIDISVQKWINSRYRFRLD